MTAERDVERVLERWLVDGVDEMPDRVYLTVLDQVERQPQRRAWRLRYWRFPKMSTPIKLAAVGAAVLAVILGGAVFLGGGAGPGPTPTPSPAPTLTPTPSPAPSPVALPAGALEAGDYRLLQPATSILAVATVPEGWIGFQPFAILGPNGTEAPGGIGIALNAPSGLYPDPCHWRPGGLTSKPAVVVGPTVDDLVDAIAASPLLDAGEATPITVDGYAGKQIDLRIPSDVDFSTCDGGEYYALAGEVIYAQGPGNIWHLLVLDVAGTRLVVIEASYDGTPATHKAQSQAILESLRFDP